MGTRDWTSPLPEVTALLGWLEEKRDRTLSEDGLLRELRTLIDDREAGKALEDAASSHLVRIAPEQSLARREGFLPDPAPAPTASIVIKTDDGG